jgi:hypothetical protein
VLREAPMNYSQGAHSPTKSLKYRVARSAA